MQFLVDVLTCIYVLRRPFSLKIPQHGWGSSSWFSRALRGVRGASPAPRGGANCVGLLIQFAMEQPLYNEYAAQLADQQYRQLNAQYETEARKIWGMVKINIPAIAKWAHILQIGSERSRKILFFNLPFSIETARVS